MPDPSPQPYVRVVSKRSARAGEMFCLDSAKDYLEGKFDNYSYGIDQFGDYGLRDNEEILILGNIFENYDSLLEYAKTMEDE